MIEDKGVEVKFMIANLKDAPLVKAGQKGLLYKFNAAYDDDSVSAYFQWIPDFGYVPETLPIGITVTKTLPISFIPAPELLVDTPTPVIVYGWKDANKENPTINTTVLVKLKDGIITTAYMLSNGNWKYDLYRNKTGGGLTTFNIVEWKKIDLE